jgi:tetratricopeptide (TPR) repeat protein
MPNERAAQPEPALRPGKAGGLDLAAGLVAVQLQLRAGEIELAREACRHLLARYPDHDQLLKWAGIAALAGNAAIEARDYLERARVRHSDDARLLAHLGEALRRSGDVEGARDALSRAVELAPDHVAGRHNLGVLLLGTGDAAAALGHFERALRSTPGDAALLTACGDANRELGRLAPAIAAYRRALEQDSGLARAHGHLGPLLLHRGHLEDAEAHCLRAVELAPDQGEYRFNRGRCLVALERLDEAMDCFADAFELMPASAELCANIARVWREMEDLAQAEHWFLRALEIDPGHLGARCGIAGVHREADLHDEAIRQLELLAEQHPDSPDAARELAEAYWDSGDATRAVEMFRRAAALRPRQTTLQARIGHVLASAGAMDEALASFRAALEQNPRCVPALHGLALAQRGDLAQQHVDRAEAQLEASKLRDAASAALHNGLAHYHDGRRDYGRAAEHARLANERQWTHRQRRGWEYDPDEFDTYIDGMAELFDAAFFRRVDGWGIPDTRLVFIVGMPRSGTTLTEQILSCHPQVLGLGERDFASRALHRLGALVGDRTSLLASLHAATPKAVRHVAEEYLATIERSMQRERKPDALRVVDKLPDNYSLLGWLVMLFPGVRIVHCRRDPRDVAVSCWMTQFAKIRWACNIEHLSRRIRAYLRLMEHWRRVLPVPMLEVDYESTVADTETVARRMLAHLDLPWDPACLRHAEADRLVRTASVTQVRQPVYRGSVGRWRRYERFLGPLFRELPVG